MPTLAAAATSHPCSSKTIVMLIDLVVLRTDLRSLSTQVVLLRFVRRIKRVMGLLKDRYPSDYDKKVKNDL